MSSRRQKLLARVNWFLQSSLKTLMNKSQIISLIREVVVTDRFHCTPQVTSPVKHLPQDCTSKHFGNGNKKNNTHICVSKIIIIGSDNGLSPGRRQAIIWTNAAILVIGPLGTNFSEILIEIQTFSFKKMHLKMSAAKWRPFCLGLNELR